MDYLLLGIIVLFGVSSISANASIPYSKEIISHSSLYGIPTSLALAQVDIESSFDPTVRGAAGEVGLLQVGSRALQDVNTELGTHYTLSDLYDPDINTFVGFSYLNILRNRWGTLYLAYRAYNTGNVISTAGKVYADSVFNKAKEY